MTKLWIGTNIVFRFMNDYRHVDDETPSKLREATDKAIKEGAVILA